MKVITPIVQIQYWCGEKIETFLDEGIACSPLNHTHTGTEFISSYLQRCVTEIDDQRVRGNRAAQHLAGRHLS